ncbi:hypothetical protein R1flu_003213 [Riccia fluitans]|uniref:Uncharacterized protein n=1 Tax=Riccia fluitans TaxID=41844 RepID=A0ABD1Y8C7_9MARC
MKKVKQQAHDSSVSFDQTEKSLGVFRCVKTADFVCSREQLIGFIRSSLDKPFATPEIYERERGVGAIVVDDHDDIVLLNLLTFQLPVHIHSRREHPSIRYLTAF